MSNAAAINARDAVALSLKLSLALEGRPRIFAEVWSDPVATTGNYIAFKGGKYGSAQLTLKVSSQDRIIAHWEGYASSAGYTKAEIEAALVAAGLKEAPKAQAKVWVHVNSTTKVFEVDGEPVSVYSTDAYLDDAMDDVNDHYGRLMEFGQWEPWDSSKEAEHTPAPPFSSTVEVFQTDCWFNDEECE